MAKPKNIKYNDAYTSVVQCVEEYILINGKPPTIREVMRMANISSTSYTAYILERLELEGKIVRVGGYYTSRCYVPTSMSMDYENMSREELINTLKANDQCLSALLRERMQLCIE